MIPHKCIFFLPPHIGIHMARLYFSRTTFLLSLSVMILTGCSLRAISQQKGTKINGNVGWNNRQVILDGSISPSHQIFLCTWYNNQQAAGIQSSFVLVEHLEAASLCSLNYSGRTFGGVETSLMLPDLFRGGSLFIAGCQVTFCLVIEVTWHEAFICHQKVVDQAIYFSEEFFCHS